MTEKAFLNTAKTIYIAMFCSFITVAVSNSHADTVSYTLDNLLLDDGSQITGSFDWTYNLGDFEGGNGVFTSLNIPYTTFSFAAGNLNLIIQTNSIEISGIGNLHDIGLDISLFLLPPLTATQSSTIDLGPSFFECCGNGFKDQGFQSGNIIPSATLAGDFDTDADVDSADFLIWQRGEVSNPPSASDLATWEANYGTEAPLLAASATVPEPSTVLLGVIASLFGIYINRHSN